MDGHETKVSAHGKASATYGRKPTGGLSRNSVKRAALAPPGGRLPIRPICAAVAVDIVVVAAAVDIHTLLLYAAQAHYTRGKLPR